MEEMAHTVTGSEDQMVWAFCGRSHSTLERPYISFIELNGEAGLLHTDKQGGGVYVIQLDQRARFSYSW